MTEILNAQWNYEPCKAEHVKAKVPEWVEGDPPLAWWRGIIGQEINAVLVTYGESCFLLANHDDTGLTKVLNGGGPDRSSSHLPLRALVTD